MAYSLASDIVEFILRAVYQDDPDLPIELVHVYLRSTLHLSWCHSRRGLIYAHRCGLVVRALARSRHVYDNLGVSLLLLFLGLVYTKGFALATRSQIQYPPSRIISSQVV